MTSQPVGAEALLVGVTDAASCRPSSVPSSAWSPDYVLLDGTLVECGPGRRQPGRLLLEAPPSRCERVGRGRSHRQAAVHLARTAQSHPPPDRGPHSPHHPKVRTPGRPRSHRPRLHRGQPLGDHTDQTAPEPGPHHNPANDQPGPISGTRPVERSTARLKDWRILRKARCSPNRMTVIAAAILTLERQRCKRSIALGHRGRSGGRPNADMVRRTRLGP